MNEHDNSEMRVHEQTEASFLRAVGFTHTTDEMSIRRLLETVANSPDFAHETARDDSGMYQFEWYRHCADDCGLVLYGVARDAEKEPGMYVDDWSIFAKNDTETQVADFFVEFGDDGKLYGYCEECETGNELEFRLVNQHDYDLYYQETNSNEPPCITGINVVALASNGTIILPVEKTEESMAEREQEDSTRREMLARIRSGDEQALRELDEMSDQMNAAIEERLFEEDYLTVFESYLMPVDTRPCIYGLLGEILSMDEVQNCYTGETILKLSVDVTGVPVRVLINKKDVFGCPTVGMRILAKVFMQGTASFKGAKPPKSRKTPGSGGLI